MEYRGKKIKGIQVYDSTKENKVIATITDTSMELDNGYKVRVLPHTEEVKTEQ